MQKYDLIVVGAGNLGAFHAYHALKLGKKVLLLERDSAPKEATVRNFGQVVPSGQSFNEWFDYGRKSLKIYNDIQDKTDITVRKNGSYYFASDEDELMLLVEAAYLFADKGYKAKLLTAKDCLKKVDDLRKNYALGGLYFPKELSVEPRQMIHLLINFMVKGMGLEYRNNTTVIDCQSRADLSLVVTADNQKIFAEKVVICNGYDFKVLLPEVFSDSNMSICKLQMLQTHPQHKLKLEGNILTGLSIRRYDSFKSCSSYNSIKKTEFHELYDSFGIHILFKQAENGSIIIGDSHEYAEINDNSKLDFGTNYNINELIFSEAKKIFSLPNWQIDTCWNGYYAKTKDDTIFEYNIDKKIFIVTGIGGKGMTTAPAFAQESIENIFDIS